MVPADCLYRIIASECNSRRKKHMTKTPTYTGRLKPAVCFIRVVVQRGDLPRLLTIRTLIRIMSEQSGKNFELIKLKLTSVLRVCNSTKFLDQF